FRASAEQPVPAHAQRDEANYIPKFDPDAPVEPIRPTGPFRTKNFVVSGATPEIRGRIAEAAERHRKEIAKPRLGKEVPDWPKLWVGKELPDRPKLCHIRIEITTNGRGSASTMDFSKKPVTFSTELRGPTQRVLADNLAHEVTHLVLADHFQQSIPRWADEGAA